MNSKTVLAKQVSRISRAVACASLASAVALPAAAQNQMEEVVVTAQKREQSASEVPMAVSLVSSEQIKNLGVVGLDELQATVPSLLVGKLGHRETIFIRGIAPPGSTLPVVGRYLDEMGLNVQSTGEGIDIPLVDLSRVEVLKGPQGTLYGEGSIGGTVKYVTQAPTFGETDAIFEASARYNTEGDAGFRTHIAGNLPIDSETFGVRLTGFYNDEPGWIDNSVLGDNANDQERWFGRIRADWVPSDTFKAEFLYQTYDSELGFTPTTNSPDGFESDSFVLNPNLSDYDLYSLKLLFDLGWADLTSVSSYLDRSSRVVLDVSGQLPGSGTRYSWAYDNESNSFTQELRLNGEADDKLFWTAGLSYRDIETGYDSSTTQEGPMFPFYEAILQAQGFDTSQEYLKGGSETSTEAMAIFGEVNYRFTDAFEMTLGARYYEDERESGGEGFAVFGVPLGANADTVDNDSTVLRVVAKYRFNDDLMMYASASEGFRSGGIQPAPLPGIPNTYEPEELTTYEIGSKGVLADGMIQFDSALFFTEYENVQVYLPNDFAFQAFTNIGEAEVLGAELSTTIFATDDLFFQLSAGYNDSEYTEPGLTHDAGDPMDSVPEWTYSVSGDYSFSFASEVDGHFRVDYFYRDETQNSVRGLAAPGASDFSESEENKQLNVRLGAIFGKHSVHLYVENALNGDAILGEPYASIVEWSLQKPRVVGVTYRTSF